MPNGPGMQAAQAVADLLNARPWPAGIDLPAGVTFTAEAKRFPNLDRDAIPAAGLMVLCVPGTPFTITPENRGDGVTRETPVAVAVIQSVRRDDAATQETLFDLLDGIAELLARSPVAGFGYPDADEGVEAEYDPEELEENGLFFAAVKALYSNVEEAAE